MVPVAHKVREEWDRASVILGLRIRVGAVRLANGPWRGVRAVNRKRVGELRVNQAGGVITHVRSKVIRGQHPFVRTRWPCRRPYWSGGVWKIEDEMK